MTGQSRTTHPAPYPVEVPRRLIRMFSFTGDTVVDPFAGTGSTALAAMETGRHSINVELDPRYVAMMEQRMHQTVIGAMVMVERPADNRAPDLPVAL